MSCMVSFSVCKLADANASTTNTSFDLKLSANKELIHGD